MALMAAGMLAGGPLARAQHRTLHMALSMDLLAGASLNDSRAAYRVWGEQVIQRFNLHMLEILPEVIYPSARMLQMIRTGQVDCVTLSAIEMAKVSSELDWEIIACEDYAADGMEYVLLVHADSRYTRIEDLKKTRLLYQQHRDNILLMPWLELLLAAAHQPESTKFFDDVEQRNKVTEVILPLFFRKVDAVALTRRAFNLAAELNPQLGRQLRIISTSPKLLVDALLFRKGCDASDRRTILHALTRIGSVPAGKQLLSLYESNGFVLRPGSAMATTLDLVRQYDRLKR